MTPFEAFCCRQPPTVKDYVQGFSFIPSIDATLLNRQTILLKLKLNLIHNQKCMKEQANKKEKIVPLKLVTWSYFGFNNTDKLPFNVVHLRSFPKDTLAIFLVVRRIGPVAYELKLPPSSRIHSVFHISQLHTYHGQDPILDFLPNLQHMEDGDLLEVTGTIVDEADMEN